MIWVYSRSKQTLHVETRFDRTHEEYRLVIRRFDGTEQVETFKDAATFQSRLSSLERQLEAESWQTHNAIAIHEGWRF
jgi:hypothetical protein